MATATAAPDSPAAVPTAAPTNPPAAAPAPSASLSVTDLEGRMLRAMAMSAPQETAEALRRNHIGRPDGTGEAGLNGRTATALDSLLATARKLWREAARRQSRIDYVAAVTAAADPATVVYAPPEPTESEEAEEVMRGILAKDPMRFPGLVSLWDATLAKWRTELATLQAPDPNLVNTWEWLQTTYPAAGQIPAWQEVDKRKKAVTILESSLQAQAHKLARIPELTGTLATTEAARVTLETAFERRAAAAIAAAGGRSVVVEALKEAARLGDAAPSADGAALLAALQSDLAGVDAQLAKLGVSPTATTATGLAASALLSQRSDLVTRIDAVLGAAAQREAASYGDLVDAAVGFDPVAWGQILARVKACPVAFPAGFAAAWEALAIDSICEAGAGVFLP